MCCRALLSCVVTLSALTPLHAQLQWSVFNETSTVAAPASNAASGVTVTVPAGQRVTLAATNFTPVDFTGVTSGEIYVTTTFKVSGGLSSIAGGTRAIGYGFYNNNGTATDYSDDNGYFTWLNGRQTGALIELRRRNGNGVSPSLLNPTGTAFNSLGTGTTTQTAGVLSDGSSYAIQLHLIRTATGVSLGNTSSTTAGSGIWLSGDGMSQTAYTNPDVPPATTRFNELGFMFLNTTANPVTLEIVSVTGLTPINPPAIATQPAAQILNPGQAGALAVVATGTAPLSYQWSKDGATVTGATSATLGFPAVATTDAGSYTVVVTNAYGTVTSSAAVVNVTTSIVPATITTHPAPVTVNAGQSATFSLAAFGSAPLTYQWQKNGAAVMGATTSTLAFATAAAADSGSYTVIVANSAAAVTSSPASLIVNTAPVITAQPVSATVTAGQPASFTVTAAGTPAPSFQWLRNGTPVAGATNTTLSFASAQLADTGVYTVRATNSVGAVTSSPAVLAIPSAMQALSFAPANNTTAINPDTPLRLTFDRAPIVGNTGRIRLHRASDGSVADTIDLGAALQLRTVGTGATPLNYFPIIVTGNTAAIYPHAGVLTYGQTYYITDEQGALRDTTGASFTGISDPGTWRFTTKAAGPAANATALTVAADGSGDFTTVQGAIDFVPVNNPQRVVITVKRGTYVEQLYVPANRPLITVRGEDRAQSIVTYPNNNNLNGNTRTRGIFTTAANDFTLETITIFNSTPQGGSQAEAFVCDGLRVLLNRVTLRSRQDTLLCNTGTTFIADSYIEGNTDFIWGTAAAYFHRCELKALDTAGGEGFYTQVRNGQGQIGFVFSECRLTGEPTARNYYLGRIDPNTGNFPYSQAVYLNCAMGPHILPVGWQLNNATTSATVQNWEYQSTDLTGATLDVRSRHASSRQIDAATATQYRNPAFVLGGWNPQLTASVEPGSPSVTVTAGTNARLTVAANGVPAPAVQWYWNGAIIAGATDATLVLPRASAADAGQYHAVITNAGGSVTSAPIAFAVRRGAYAGLYPLTFLASPAGQIDAALFVRDDGTGAFLSSGGNAGGLTTRRAFVNPDGTFRFATSGATPRTVQGSIDPSGAITGDMGGTFFRGARGSDTGLSQRIAGFYQMGELNGSTSVSTLYFEDNRGFATLETGSTLGWARLAGLSAPGTIESPHRVDFLPAADGSTASTTLTLQNGPTIQAVGTNDRDAHRARLAQLSSRVQVGAASPAVAGFVVSGDAPTRVLVRAVGPTLGSAFAVANALANPRFELFRGATPLATNTGWSTALNSGELAQAAAQGGAFALPANSADSALLITLAPGAYTAVVSSATGATTGNALIEFYDLSAGTAGQRLINLSSRATVGPGGAALIAGLVVASPQPKRVLVRAVGPGLAQFGVTDALARPVVTLFRGGTALSSNTGWTTRADVAITASNTFEIGAFQLSPADSGFVTHLAAGAYTAVVTSADGATGTALVEIYELP